MLCAQAWKPGSQHAGEKRRVAGLGGTEWSGASVDDGGLAQLGERLPCKQEVSGSIPLISTMKRKLPIRIQSPAEAGLNSRGDRVERLSFRRKAEGLAAEANGAKLLSTTGQ